MIIALSVGAVVVLIGAFLLFDHRRRKAARAFALRVTFNTPPTATVEGSRLHPADVFTIRTSDPASVVVLLELPNSPPCTFIFLRHLSRDDGDSFAEVMHRLNLKKQGCVFVSPVTGTLVLYATPQTENQAGVFLYGNLCVTGFTYDARELETPLIVHLKSRKTGRTCSVALPLPHNLSSVKPQMRR